MLNVEKPDHWRLEHMRTIGASNAPRIVGKARFKPTKRGLWGLMRDANAGKVPPPLGPSDDLRRGSRFEATALELMAETLQVSVTPHDQDTFVYNPAMPWAHVLPDGWIGTRTAEVKCPRPATVARCNAEGLIPEWWVGRQHTLAVTETDIAYVGILDPISALLHTFEVRRDETFIRGLLDEERRFYESLGDAECPWQDEEQQDEEPMPGKVILEGEDAVSTATAFARLYRLVKESESMLNDAKARLIALSRNAESFEVPGILRVRHKAQAGSLLFDKEAAIREFPDLKEGRFYKHAKPSRPFVPTVLWRDEE